jgi:hypothetical protein
MFNIFNPVALRDNVRLLNRVLFGDRDYAVVGRKVQSWKSRIPRCNRRSHTVALRIQRFTETAARVYPLRV